MYLAAIFATFLLAMHPGRDVACRVSGGEQEKTAQDQKPPQDAEAPASANGAEQQQPESKPDATPSDRKAEAPSPKKPEISPPPNAARKHPVRSKKPIPPTANGEPRKIVVHHGGASEPVTQIIPGITPEEAVHQRESAEQLLAASESSLEKLAGRSLKPRQQGMVVQIRQYIDAARSALKESDTQRAHTLALKAYLLADDLAKH